MGKTNEIKIRMLVIVNILIIVGQQVLCAPFIVLWHILNILDMPYSNRLPSQIS
jgi:hypothetical protein